MMMAWGRQIWGRGRGEGINDGAERREETGRTGKEDVSMKGIVEEDGSANKRRGK